MLDVLAGAPVAPVAARTGLQPDELAAAVEVYQQAGEHALAAQIGPPQWQQLYVQFTDWDKAEQLVADRLNPVLELAREDGRMTSWWFIRKHPCWRVRLLTPDSSGHLPAAVTGLLDELAAAGAVRWWPGIYEPETAAFGGAASMDIAHTLFRADSHAVLTSPHGALGRRELSVLLCSTLMRAAGLEWYEQGDVWHRITHDRPAPDSTDPAKVRALAPPLLLADTGPDAPLLQSDQALRPAAAWVAAFRSAGTALGAAARGGALDRGLRHVIAYHVLFHWTRLGLEQALPVSGDVAIALLQPLVNLIRLTARAGQKNTAYDQLTALHHAVQHGGTVTSRGHTVGLTGFTDDATRDHIRPWLHFLLVDDGTRLLASTCQWARAAAHAAVYDTAPDRLTEARQTGIVTVLAGHNPAHATRLIESATVIEPWETAVSGLLRHLACTHGVDCPGRVLLDPGHCRHEPVRRRCRQHSHVPDTASPGDGRAGLAGQHRARCRHARHRCPRCRHDRGLLCRPRDPAPQHAPHSSPPPQPPGKHRSQSRPRNRPPPPKPQGRTHKSYPHRRKQPHTMPQHAPQQMNSTAMPADRTSIRPASNETLTGPLREQAQQLAKILRTRIITQKWKPGYVFSYADLAKEFSFGMHRTCNVAAPAVRALREENLLESRPRVGIRVRIEGESWSPDDGKSNLAHDVYIEIKLRESLHRGTYRAGDQFPPIYILADEFGVSLATVRKAIRGIQEQGLLEVRKSNTRIVTYSLHLFTAEEILRPPVRRNPGKTKLLAFGEQRTLAEWAHDQRCLVEYKVLYNRYNMGWNLERALRTPKTPPSSLCSAPPKSSQSRNSGHHKKPSAKQIVRKHIAESSYLQGHVLSATDIALRLNVRETVVRDSFRDLRNEGLLAYHPDIGFAIPHSRHVANAEREQM
ncbi:thiopeptide-type bacteriocin biosynthesis protein [Streptomyces sp. enrichment culture]|uniref:thiopeptide-type bacteriocin biosynthesis protein n=1 Tax=Streptomyces sp. enrichment culture TaxID=1795815 RepID=UPI003F54B6B6